MAVDERNYTGEGMVKAVQKGMQATAEKYQDAVSDRPANIIEAQIGRTNEIRQYVRDIAVKLDAMLDRNAAVSVFNRPEEDKASEKPLHLGLISEMETATQRLYKEVDVLGEIVNELEKRF